MSRPRNLPHPARLNLVVDAKDKKGLSKMAFDQGISISQLVRRLHRKEKARIEAMINGPEGV